MTTEGRRQAAASPHSLQNNQNLHLTRTRSHVAQYHILLTRRQIAEGRQKLWLVAIGVVNTKESSKRPLQQRNCGAATNSLSIVTAYLPFLPLEQLQADPPSHSRVLLEPDTFVPLSDLI